MNTKPRTIFQSTKSVISSTADIAVTTATTASTTVKLGGQTINNNLKAMYASTVRENVVENSKEVAESLNITDAELDKLEELLEDKNLTARQKARIKRQIQMWEQTAATIESTVKL